MTASSTISTIVIVIILIGLQDRICARRQHRGKMGMLIPIAVIYSVVAIVLMTRFLARMGFFMAGFGLSGYVIPAANSLLLAVYILVKWIAARRLQKLDERSGQVESIARRAYEYSEIYNTWFLQKKYGNFRKFISAVHWGTAAAAGVSICMAVAAAGAETRPVVAAFPAAIALIMAEVNFFFGGLTQSEFEHKISGSDADSYRAGYFFRLREILEKKLPEPLLSAQTGFELAGKMTPEDFIDDLRESDDRVDCLVGEYFKANQRYTDAEIDGVKATLNLVHRKNVVYFNPFYQDLGAYITLPVVYALLSGRKCLLITGRMSTKEDAGRWLKEILADYSHMPSLWRLAPLTAQPANCEVGVISFPELYDNEILTENRDWLREVDIVIMIEPSAILSTGQVALSILASEMKVKDDAPVYFVCDRMVDGLVDTLSHVLRADFTNVAAPPVPRCIYTGMTWNADGDFCRQQFFDRETQYLGNGIELAAVALKNQMPHVSWYGERRVPLRDIRWIAGQQYRVICQYINQPAQQAKLYEKIDFIPNLWAGKKQKEQFAIVEDEFDNMFSMMWTFLTRGENQSFINILSEDYLLRDYMRCNQQLFLSNPNAIPSLVPDYAKTERNTLIKLILIMRYRQVTDQEVLDEFHLVGCKDEDAYDLLCRMLIKYTEADHTVLNIETVSEEIDDLTLGTYNKYSISEEGFRRFFATSLAKAYYILEEEEEGKSYVDARFFSHVLQNVMPGQLVTYDGKYYQVRHLSPQTGVILRRASDLFDARKYYRQVRSYRVEGTSEPLSLKKVMDIEIAFIQRDIQVETTGYLEMEDLRDLRNARYVDLSEDPSSRYFGRAYRNKTVLRIRLPEAEEEIRFTCCLLLMEVFRTIFPEGHQYLAVTAKCLTEVSGVLRHIVYPLDGDVSEDYIYIIEDSEIDLGLLEAIEKNWMELMEILCDFLDWHFEKMREPEAADPVPPSFAYDAYTREEVTEEKKSLLARFAARLRKMVGRGDKASAKAGDAPDAPAKAEDAPKAEAVPGAADAVPAEETGAEVEAAAGDEIAAAGDTAAEAEPGAEPVSAEAMSAEAEPVLIEGEMIPDEHMAGGPLETGAGLEQARYNPDAEGLETGISSGESADISDLDGTDIFNENGPAEADVLLDSEGLLEDMFPVNQTWYQKKCFLKFGYDVIDRRIDLDGLLRYLRVRGWANNDLTQARKRDLFEKTNLDMDAVNFCDFCNRPLSGVSYEVMNDGRVRCNDCSATAITTLDEFRSLFYQVLELMESFYGIQYRIPITVTTDDARTIAKGVGRVFRPSSQVAARALGYAQLDHGQYSLHMENGTPRLVALDTMVHEMTHIWQYMNWDMDLVRRIYSMPDPNMSRVANDVVYEGMAMWVAIQYLYQIGETRYAAETEYVSSQRKDIYGLGFNLFREQYPLVKDSSISKVTPFMAFPPIDPDRVKEVVAAVFSSSSQE